MTLVHDFLQHSAKRLPDKIALQCDGRRLTYAELDASANRLANALLAHGLRQGDRVAIFLPNSVEAVVGIFAALKAGGTFVVVNASTKPPKLTFILNNCEASALITNIRRAEALENLSNNVASLNHIILCGSQTNWYASKQQDNWQLYDAIQAAYPAERPTVRTIDLDLVCLIYTSGSTGEPKGVMSDHSNVVFVADSVIAYLDNVEDDIVCCALALSYSYGLYQLLMVFRFGGTLLLERGFTYPAAVLKNLEQERVTGFPLVPTMMAMLLQMNLEHYDLSHLRYITSAGAALPPRYIHAFSDRLPHTALFSMYGLTETKRTLYLPPDQVKVRPSSVGIAIPGTEVWLEDESGQRLGPGQTGELVIRGRHVMHGYWRAPEETALRFRPGPIPGERVCYSGDLFRMDDEGYFYFVARKDDIIKSRGEKVAPKEIEDTLYKLDGIIEAAVTGVEDPILGEAIKVVVVCRDDTLSEIDIVAHCRKHLEDYMIPKYVEFRHELPKTASGKINKRALA